MIRSLTVALVFVILAALPLSAETIKCTECGMMVDAGSKFTSRIVDGDRTLFFCDVGDLLAYLNKHQQQTGRIEVKDYTSGEWITAQKASYVSAPKKFNSPMGWGIAAFKDRKDAAGQGTPLDFTAALKAAK